MTQAVDPGREKVERADEAVRDTLEPVIDDPTVFVKSAALGALTALALAKLAAARAQQPAIRAFADRMRRSHETIRRELAAVAARKALDVPDSLVYDDERMLASAPTGAGSAFEAWFLRQVRAEYFRATDLYTSASRMADADLAAFARKSLGILVADRDVATSL
jgi:predicted outer membrane protein